MGEQDANRAVGRLIHHNAPYWAGEFAVARRYFANGSRQPARDATWLGLQMFKEWTGSGVYGPGDASIDALVQRCADALGRARSGLAREDLEQVSQQLQFATDELNHYLILWRAYQRIAPDSRKSIEEMGDLHHARRLVELRAAVRTEPLGDWMVELSEGGGLGLYFAVCEQLGSQPDLAPEDQIILSFARATVADETEHMTHRFRSALALGLSADDWERIDAGLQRVSAQKLRERNEQFGGQFSSDELEHMGRDFDAGRRYATRHLTFLNERLGIPLATP